MKRLRNAIVFGILTLLLISLISRNIGAGFFGGIIAFGIFYVITGDKFVKNQKDMREKREREEKEERQWKREEYHRESGRQLARKDLQRKEKEESHSFHNLVDSFRKRKKRWNI